MTADRRSFLARVTGALALLATGTAPASATHGRRDAVRRSAFPAPARDEWDDSWLDRLTTGHRQIFDVPGHLSGGALFYVNNYLRGLEASGLPADDMQAVLGLHGNAPILGMRDDLWAKYKLGEMFRANDPRTREPAVRNAWLVADDPAAPSAAWTVTALQARNVAVIVCNNSLRGLASTLARQHGGTADDVRAELVAGLAPGVIPVPAMVAAIHRAQLKGCTYVYAGLAQPPER